MRASSASPTGSSTTGPAPACCARRSPTPPARAASGATPTATSLELKVIKRLLDAGLKLQQARQAVECLRGDLGVDLASAQLVLADSRSILATSDGELVDLLAGGQGVFNVLPLSGRGVRARGRHRRADRPGAPTRTPTDERHPAAAYLAAGGAAAR